MGGKVRRKIDQIEPAQIDVALRPQRDGVYVEITRIGERIRTAATIQSDCTRPKLHPEIGGVPQPVNYIEVYQSTGRCGADIATACAQYIIARAADYSRRDRINKLGRLSNINCEHINPEFEGICSYGLKIIHLNHVVAATRIYAGCSDILVAD